MNVEIHIIEGPIDAHTAPAGARDPHGSCGAELRFDGVVRAVEDDRTLAALQYDVYEPMASRQLLALGQEVARTHALLALVCLHSRGRVGVGECSMRVTVRSAHRAEALAAMGEFIDRLKRDVPIWKRPIRADA